MSKKKRSKIVMLTDFLKVQKGEMSQLKFAEIWDIPLHELHNIPIYGDEKNELPKKWGKGENNA